MRSLHSKSGSQSAPSTERRKYKPRKVTGTERFSTLKKGGVPDYTDFAYKEAVDKLKSMLNNSYVPSKYYRHQHDDSDEESGVSFMMSDRTRVARLAPRMKTHLSPAPPSAPSSAPPELLSFVERQEDYIEQLEKESQYCRDELSQLLGKVKELISENESLHAHQKSSAYKTPDHFLDKRSETSTNYQMDLIHSRPHLEGPTIVFESRISELEAQLTQVRMDLKKAQDEATMYKKKCLDTDPTCTSSDFYRQIETLHREKRELSDALNKLQTAVALAREKETDSSRKFLRTQDVAEKAQMDRQQAEMEVQRLKSELDHQHQRLLDVLSEQTRKIAEERSQAERRYLQHVEQLSSELTVQRDTATKLQLELERHLRIEDDLRRDLSAKQLTADNVRKELQSKIVSLQSELATALTERDCLEQDLSTNRMSGERTERFSKQESVKLQVEVQALRQRCEKTDTDLIQARRENLKLSEEVSALESEMVLYKSRIGEMEADGSIKRASSVRELEGVVEKQSQTMAQLTQQCQSLTRKLEDSSLRHKQEMEELQSSIEFLTNRLETSISARQWPDDAYQQPHPVEQYPETFEPEPNTYHPEPTPQIEPEPTPAEPYRSEPIQEKRALSRTNSRGDRSESPLTRPDSRKSLARRESKLQMSSPENKFQSTPEPYRPETYQPETTPHQSFATQPYSSEQYQLDQQQPYSPQQSYPQGQQHADYYPPEQISEPLPEKRVLSRPSSRGDRRSESPLVRPSSKSPLNRRESKLHMNPNEQQTFSPENKFQVNQDPHQAYSNQPYPSDQYQTEQPNYQQSYPQEQPQYDYYAPDQHAYPPEQHQYPPEQMTYPQEQPDYSPAQETAYNYGEPQYNPEQTDPNRTNSRESMRKQGYLQEGTRKSSSGESTTNYGHSESQGYEGTSPERKNVTSIPPAASPNESVIGAARPKPQVPSVRRENVTKQGNQRNTPTKLQ